MSAVELTQRPRRRCLSLLDQARISSTEANQAIVRLRVGGAYLALLGVLALFGQGDAIGAAWGPAIAYSVLAVAWVGVICFDLFRTPQRIGLGLLFDHLVFAYGYYAGEAGFVLVFWAPIFATIGYGLRFGVEYARASMLVGSLLMSIAVACSPFWQAQPYMAAGIIIGAVALPFYALHLSRRIEKSREHAETKARHFERAASTDPLTGLLNRRGFNDVLESHIAGTGTSAILYIDLDGFKAINDSGGHDLGDHVLADVAHRLHGCLRASDPVGRIGGDEFAVLVTNLLEVDDAYRLANKIIEAIGAIRVPGHPDLALGASIGVCLLPHPEARCVESIMRVADMLMYRAKRAGKNCYASSEGTAPKLADA